MNFPLASSLSPSECPFCSQKWPRNFAVVGAIVVERSCFGIVLPFRVDLGLRSGQNNPPPSRRKAREVLNGSGPAFD